MELWAKWCGGGGGCRKTQDPSRGWGVQACYEQREQQIIQDFARAVFPMCLSLLCLLNWLLPYDSFSVQKPLLLEVFPNLGWNGCPSSVGLSREVLSCSGVVNMLGSPLGAWKLPEGRSPLSLSYLLLCPGDFFFFLIEWITISDETGAPDLSHEFPLSWFAFFL